MAIMITRMVVITGKSLSKLSLVHLIRNETNRRPTVKLATRKMAVPIKLARHAGKVDMSCRGEAERDGDDDPADRVLEDGGGDDNLSEIAAIELHLTHDDRDDLNGRDGKRGTEEERREKSLLRVGQQGLWQEPSEREAAGEGNRNPGD